MNLWSPGYMNYGIMILPDPEMVLTEMKQQYKNIASCYQDIDK